MDSSRIDDPSAVLLYWIPKGARRPRVFARSTQPCFFAMIRQTYERARNGEGRVILSKPYALPTGSVADLKAVTVTGSTASLLLTLALNQ